MADFNFKARLLPAVDLSTSYTLGSTAKEWNIYGKIYTRAVSSNSTYNLLLEDNNSDSNSCEYLRKTSALKYVKDSSGYGLKINNTRLNVPTNGSYTLTLPSKNGTLATTDDITTGEHSHSNYVLKSGDTMTGSLTVAYELTVTAQGSSIEGGELRLNRAPSYSYDANLDVYQN